MKHVLKTAVLSLVVSTATSCAFLGGGDDDPGVKNSSIKFNPPRAPFEKMALSTADQVWQSQKTGNTIAVNSLCKKYQDATLDSLKKNILSGIENTKIEKSENINYQGREAQRVLASGTTDGVPITLSLLVFKKNNCTYDLAFIARQKNFQEEIGFFEKFIEDFRVP